MNELLTRIHDIGIVPVVVLEDAERAVPLAGALVEGGLPVAEITFRTEAAGDAIKAIVKEVPEMIVGAGTVLTKEQADRAIEAGALFDGSSVIRDDRGTRLIYLDGEFAGFAIHIIRKGIIERG